MARRKSYKKKTFQRSDTPSKYQEQTFRSLNFNIDFRRKSDRARFDDRIRLQSALNRLKQYAVTDIELKRRLRYEKSIKEASQFRRQHLNPDTGRIIDRDEVCKERRRRRQSLFKLKKAGKGVAGPRERKYTEESKIKC